MAYSDLTLTVTIDRTNLGWTPLVLYSDRAHLWGITKFRRPEKVARRTYMPDAAGVHGSELISASFDQSNLIATVVPFGAADEAAQQAARSELEDAITQLRFTVTTKLGGAPTETWRADFGDLTLSASDGRDPDDVRKSRPAYILVIPCHPIPGETP